MHLSAQTSLLRTEFNEDPEDTIELLASLLSLLSGLWPLLLSGSLHIVTDQGTIIKLQCF